MSRSRQQPSLDVLNAQSSKLRSQITGHLPSRQSTRPTRVVRPLRQVWVFDNYPSEHLASSGLIELLEEATRRYKDDSSYKGDLRCLKLWTLYASLVDKPRSVFKFTLTNGIGTAYALLFEEYALALERDSWYVSRGAYVVQLPHALSVTQPQMKFTALAYSAKHDL